MIAVDTSALVAIAFGEQERSDFLRVVECSEAALVSVVSAVEARIVVHARRGERAVILLDDLLRQRPFEMVSPDAEETRAAFAAFVTYGRGSGHPAGLNFGDLFSYALAKVRGIPLLFKGDDFGHTDIVRASPSHGGLRPLPR